MSRSVIDYAKGFFVIECFIRIVSKYRTFLVDKALKIKILKGSELMERHKNTMNIKTVSSYQPTYARIMTLKESKRYP